MPQIQRSSRFAGPALFAYVAVLLIGTHLPGSTLEQVSFSDHDKILHFAAYAVLSLLAFNFMSAHPVDSRKCFVLLFVSLAVFAALDELTQIPVPGRFGSWGDWRADIAGIFVSLTLAACLAQYRRFRLASLQRIRG